MKTIRQWVGGEYYEGSPLGVIPVENPATGEVTAELLQASKEDLDHTGEVARDAQKVVGKLLAVKTSGDHVQDAPARARPPGRDGAAHR